MPPQNHVNNDLVLKLVDVVKIFEESSVKTTALRGITLELKKNSVYFIQGPSGCGKSTLLNIIGLLDEPTTGDIYSKADSLNTWSEEQKLIFRREKIGYIFQNSNLFPNFTVYQNLIASLHYTKFSREEKDKLINLYLDAIQLEEKRNALPNELSGGQKQRIAIVAALIKNPSILIADEPTAELDLENKKRVIDLIFDLKKKIQDCCIIIASHDTFFEKRADYIVKMQDGLKIQDFKNPANTDLKSENEARNSEPSENLAEFRLVLRCSKCNSPNIKKFVNNDAQSVKIIGNNAVGMATVFCLDCTHGETKSYILHTLRIPDEEAT